MSSGFKNKSFTKSLLVSEFLGFLAFFLVLTIFSFVISKIPYVSELVFKVASLISLAVGAFFSGLIFSKVFKSKGLVLGAVAGLFMFLMSLIIDIIFFRCSFSNIFLKLVLLLISGAFGGIVGVNV